MTAEMFFLFVYFIMNQEILSYILRDVNFAEVDNVCRVPLREPMNLCTFVSEEGDDGEAPHSETTSLLSYTLRYVSFTGISLLFIMDH